MPDFRVRISGALLPPVAVKSLIALFLVVALIGFGAPANNAPAWVLGLLPILAMAAASLIIAGSRASERTRMLGISLITLVLICGAVYAAINAPSPALVWFQINAAVGIALVYSAFRARDGDTIHCARCDYPFSDTPRCPECGADLSLTNALLRGTRRRRPWLAALGVLLILSSAVLVTAPLLMHGAWRIAPTNLLLNLGARTTPPEGIFAALNQRLLTQQERLELAARLIEMHDTPAGLTPQQADWLAVTAKMNLLPGPLADRYFNGTLNLTLQASNPAHPGEPIRVELTRGNLHPISPLALPISAWVTGWWVDDAQVADAWDDWDSATRFDAPLLQTLPTSGPNHLPGITITPSAPGTVTVRVVVWLAAAPTRPSLVLNPDHTPRFGAGNTPIWTRRVELIKQVQIPQSAN